MEKELLRRRFGPPIRLEITDTTSPFLSQLLADQLGVSQDEVYRLPSPLDLTVLFELGSVDRPDLKNRPFVPTTNRQIAEVESSRAQDIFAAIRERDILLHHPYDSFSTSVQAFLAQAAADPKVLAIKQTLYRTSSNSPIIDALIDAAHAGKQVLALVEIKARFDEDANIAWARKLERAGVHVVYGIVGLKTHCKLIEVVRQEADGLRRYCHVGTGNYNPKTARLYTDLGLLTCDPVVGQDLTRLFNQLSGYAPKSSFHRLLVAPRTVRTGLIQRIRREEDAARAGKEAWIKIKVNSIVDEKTIDALYRASQASNAASALGSPAFPACPRTSAYVRFSAASWSTPASTPSAMRTARRSARVRLPARRSTSVRLTSCTVTLTAVWRLWCVSPPRSRLTGSSSTWTCRWPTPP